MTVEISKYERLALKSVLLGDFRYVYRQICRYYSKEFSTPLMEVYNLPYHHVLTNYLEDILETRYDKKGRYELAIEMFYPEKQGEEDRLLQEQIKQWEKEEEEKNKQKQNQVKEKDNQQKKETEEKTEIKMGEDVFSHLDEEEP